MNKISFLIPFLLFLLWEIAFSKIRLDEVVVTYTNNGKPKTMHVMASNNRGISWRPQYSPNIYFTQHYGYYEVFMCPCMYWQQYTTGCLDEIVTEKSFRFANVATPNFSWFIDKFTHHERKVVDTTKFELCIIDGTQHMRKSSMKRSQASLGQRMRMPRYCWVIRLHYQPISYDTLWKMQNATKLELKGKRKKLYDYKEEFYKHRKEETKLFNEIQEKLMEAWTKHKYLEAENARLKEELEKARTNINIDISQKTNIEIGINQKEIKQKEINQEKVENQMNNVTNEVIEHYEHSTNVAKRIEKYSDEGKKKIDKMEKDVAGMQNKMAEDEKKTEIEINNKVVFEESNNMNPTMEKNNLSEELRKKIEMQVNTKLNIRKKRNASYPNIDVINTNNQLVTDKTNEKLKEIEDGMIMDSQGPAFNRSIEEKLDKMHQDILYMGKEFGYSKKSEAKNHSLRSIEEGMIRNNKIIENMMKEQGIKDERMIKNKKIIEDMMKEQSEVKRPSLRSIEEGMIRNNKIIENMMKEQGIKDERMIKNKKIIEDMMKEQSEVKRPSLRSIEEGMIRNNKIIENMMKEQGIKDERMIKNKKIIEDMMKEQSEVKRPSLRSIEEGMIRNNKIIENMMKEQGIKDERRIKNKKIIEDMMKEHGIKDERMNGKYSNKSKVKAPTINRSTVEHLENKSPEKLPFHAKKAVFNGEKMNKGKENVNPHGKIVPKFADVPLGNLEWKCAKFHGKNAENCHKWEKIADKVKNNAKIEYRSVLPSGKCSAKVLGEFVLKHSILNASNIAKGSNGKDGVQIGEAPLTQEECKEKSHKGINNRQKRNVEDEITWEQLDKIVPKKQAMLFKMASNDLLTVGSIEFDDFQNEIATVTNVNAEQLLEYDEKEFEKLGEKFEKEIFHKIAPKRIEKIISDAEETFENVFGIYSMLEKVEKDNKEIDKTIKDIEQEQEKMKEEGVSVDEYCEKECTALIEYDEKIVNEIKKEKIEQNIKTEDKRKGIIENPMLKETKAEHSEPKETKAEHSEPKVTKVEHSMPKESKAEHSLPKQSKAEHSLPKESKADHSLPKESKVEHSLPKESKVEHSLPKEMKKKDKGIEIVEHTVPKTKNDDKLEEIKGHMKTEEMKESEIMESEIENHGQQSEAIHNTNGVLSKVYNKSKEHMGNVAKFVGNKSWEIASHIGNKMVQAASNAWSKKTENSSNIGSSSQTHETPGTSKEPKETKKGDKGKGIEEIVESEIEDHGVQPETNDNADSILNKMYNKSKENLGNAGKYVGKKSWEIAAHIGNKVVQTASNSMSKKTENSSKIGGSSQTLETPGTSKEPKETKKGDKGKGIEEIIEKEIEDQKEQSEASSHAQGVLSKIYNKSEEHLGEAGKYVGKKSWEIASHIGNTVVQTATNALSKKPENTKLENTSSSGSTQQAVRTPGTAHIRLGHQMYQRKTDQPKAN